MWLLSVPECATDFYVCPVWPLLKKDTDVRRSLSLKRAIRNLCFSLVNRFVRAVRLSVRVVRLSVCKVRLSVCALRTKKNTCTEQFFSVHRTVFLHIPHYFSSCIHLAGCLRSTAQSRFMYPLISNRKGEDAKLKTVSLNRIRIWRAVSWMAFYLSKRLHRALRRRKYQKCYHS